MSRLLRENGLRASHFAVRIGVSHATVGRWLKGEDVPCAKSCYRIAEFTSIPVEDVLRAAGHIPESTQKADKTSQVPFLE